MTVNINLSQSAPDGVVPRVCVPFAPRPPASSVPRTTPPAPPPPAREGLPVMSVDGVRPDSSGDVALSAAISAVLAPKADRVSGAVAGNLASLDSAGNLADSGTKPSDFATAARATALEAADTVIGGRVSALETNKADASQVYTKTEVEGILQALKTGSREVVSTLPSPGEAMKIYMVSKSSAQTNNAYDEYIWTSAGTWEKIGDTEIDLSGYVQKDGSKVLSTNDYTDRDKGIVDGIFGPNVAAGDRAVAAGSRAVAIGGRGTGSNATSASGASAVAIGAEARASATAAVQLSNGLNETPKSLQFRGANLFVVDSPTSGSVASLGLGFPDASDTVRGAVYVDNEFKPLSSNPVQSRVVKAALDGKAASSHSHVIANVTGLQTALDGKAASSHSHAVSDVTGLQTALDGKAASSHSHGSISDSSNNVISADRNFSQTVTTQNPGSPGTWTLDGNISATLEYDSDSGTWRSSDSDSYYQLSNLGGWWTLEVYGKNGFSWPSAENGWPCEETDSDHLSVIDFGNNSTIATATRSGYVAPSTSTSTVTGTLASQAEVVPAVSAALASGTLSVPQSAVTGLSGALSELSGAVAGKAPATHSHESISNATTGASLSADGGAVVAQVNVGSWFFPGTMGLMTWSPELSAWVNEPDELSGYQNRLRYVGNNTWRIYNVDVNVIPLSEQDQGDAEGGESATTLSFFGGEVNGSRNSDTYTTSQDHVAFRSELSVTQGTGQDADKATITLGNGKSATVLTAHQDVSGKYAKPSGGIPKTDLASDVQTSLGLANTALQPYPFVNASTSGNDLTLQDAKVQSYRPLNTQTKVVHPPANVSGGPTRDMVLLIDYTAIHSGFTLTWESGKFHPHTDAATDLACTPDAVNVYYISEYKVGNYVVSRWVETAAATGGS